MRVRNLWLLCTMLVAGFVVLASPAPLSAIDTCATNCDCTVSCSTECLAGYWVHTYPEWTFVTTAENCGEYGVCAGSTTCTTPGLPCQSCTHVINGTSGGDTINGGANRECIYGLGGNDTIDGGAGDDRLYCGNGTDTAFGNSGNDCLWGEADNDNLQGDSGNDYCDGGAGADSCSCETKVSC